MASALGCFWGMWGGQGLEWAGLGLGKFPRKPPGLRTEVRDVKNRAAGFVIGVDSGLVPPVLY